MTPTATIFSARWTGRLQMKRGRSLPKSISLTRAYGSIRMQSRATIPSRELAETDAHLAKRIQLSRSCRGSGGYISREKHAITAKAGVGGSISPNGTSSITNGNNQNYTITANNGYKIADVLVDGKSIGAVASYKFVKVQTAHTIEARFATAPMKDPDTGFSDIAKSDYF